MRKVLPLLGICTLLIAGNTTAQISDRFSYAITDIQPGGANWSFLRKINLQTGEYSPVLLQGNDMTFTAREAGSKKQLSQPLHDPRFGNLVNAPFVNGVAAMAYDKKNNRLWYTPMLFDQLRYIDLKTMQVYYVTGNGFTGNPVRNADQGNIVTRMAVAADGYVYALTNDATQFIRFGTGKKNQPEDMGGLVDDPANGGISIHNACTSFGGDMVAGEDGKLYIFSARNYVFSVDPATKVARLLGQISGLPEGYSVNGAAVESENTILVSSAVKNEYYLVDARNWTASPYRISGTAWTSSDLANSNLLSLEPKITTAPAAFSERQAIPNSGDGRMGIFPNPVTHNQFVIQFSKMLPGSYTLFVTDVTGRQILQQQFSMSGENHVQAVKMDPSASRGIYLVSVKDAASRMVYSSKLVLQ